ncbi:MAG: DUF1579 domain-containing protein [Armatimonadetes bacterium]|nr:DUF1579 domain-containing protein [Armatimonadota bacterium]
MEPIQATPQHQWLLNLVGEWKVRPGGEEGFLGGSDTITALGEAWIIGRLSLNFEGSRVMSSQTTLGFDEAKGKFVGTWVGDMMSNQWVYEGELSEDETELRLYSVGPAFDGSGEMNNYCDTVVILNENERLLRGTVQQPDGTWHQFMETHFTRV